jgi:hypothetical protein
MDVPERTVNREVYFLVEYEHKGDLGRWRKFDGQLYPDEQFLKEAVVTYRKNYPSYNFRVIKRVISDTVMEEL